MRLNPDHLLQHYASLSDEALLDTKRSDLTELAQTYYDDEMKRRGLSPGGKKPRAGAKAQVSQRREDPGEQGVDDGEKPSWLDDAAEVFTARVVRGSTDAAVNADMALRALEAADIPCFLECRDISNEEEPSAAVTDTQEWRLSVPGEFNMQAASILDRDVFNEEFEHDWRAHIEALSDDQLLAMSPEVVFCGLFDRIERITRAYEEELARRGFDPEKQ